MKEKPLLLTVEAAAQLLSVSPNTVRRELLKGNLRAVKLRSLLRIERTELDRYISVLRGGFWERSHYVDLEKLLDLPRSRKRRFRR